MKIVIRNSIFETNSSSSHSLIITNKENLDKDVNAHAKKVGPCLKHYNAVEKKEDKVLFLAGLFDYEVVQSNSLKEEYNLFLKVLKDNNEEELLKQVKDNKKEYKKASYDEPYCVNYFCDGVLMDCSCSFYNAYLNYFQIIINYSAIYEELSKNKDYDENNFLTKVQEAFEKQKEEVYQKLYDFIYKDGIIVAYELF